MVKQRCQGLWLLLYVLCEAESMSPNFETLALNLRGMFELYKITGTFDFKLNLFYIIRSLFFGDPHT